jgi:general secretion pathway protein I
MAPRSRERRGFGAPRLRRPGAGGGGQRRGEGQLKRAAGGFTLLEVLVALTIIAVALIAALRGAMALTSSAADTRLRLLAITVAQNRILELRLAGAAPPPGQSRFECPQAGRRLACVQDVRPTPNPFFRRIEVRVEAGDAQSDALSGARTDAQPPHELAQLMALLRAAP